MASPVKPNQFCNLVPTSTTDPCTSVKNLFFTLPKLLCDFFAWFLNDDGTISSDAVASVFPAGSIIGFAGDTAPSGWLLCNGQEVSRSDFAALFAAIGTTWGAGDGVTTFGIPNGKKRALVGSDSSASAFALGQYNGEETHLLTAAESGLPSHRHAIGVEGSDEPAASSENGKLEAHPDVDTRWQKDDATAEIGYTRNVASADASVAHNNMPPYFAGNWIIKY